MIINITKNTLDYIFKYYASEEDFLTTSTRISLNMAKDTLNMELIHENLLYIKKLKEYFKKNEIQYSYTNSPRMLAFYKCNSQIRSASKTLRTVVMEDGYNIKFDERMKLLFQSIEFDKNSCVILRSLGIDLLTIRDEKPKYEINYDIMRKEDNEVFLLPKFLLDGTLQLQLKEYEE